MSGSESWGAAVPRQYPGVVAQEAKRAREEHGQASRKQAARLTGRTRRARSGRHRGGG